MRAILLMTLLLIGALACAGEPEVIYIVLTPTPVPTATIVPTATPRPAPTPTLTPIPTPTPTRDARTGPLPSPTPDSKFSGLQPGHECGNFFNVFVGASQYPVDQRQEQIYRYADKFFGLTPAETDDLRAYCEERELLPTPYRW